MTIFAYGKSAPPVDLDELRSIRDNMAVRGPDGSGEWISQDQRVGIGHRRLSIIDLTERAAQPMQTADGSAVISFNGEIYNYKELKHDLEKQGCVFQSDSDTEVLLHLYLTKGEEMVRDLRGMFAFVIWDARKNALFLARDPYGMKPLYYSDDGKTIRIASQVKALLRSKSVSRVKDPAGIVGFFLTGNIPEPFTLYQSIRQVPAGNTLWADGRGVSHPKQYVTVAEIFHEAGTNSQSLSSSEQRDITRTIHEAVLDSIRHHFVSDVPVGIFLSSGIDSAALVALARECRGSDVQTMTLAFEEFRGKRDDEAPLAEEIARRYQTKHKTRVLNRAEFHSELPRIFEVMDQPTIDGINTYFISKAASESGLKVALSGLGGDEMFGGYPSFHDIPRMVRLLQPFSKMPFLADSFRSLYSSVIAQHISASPKIAGILKFGGTYSGAYFLCRGLFMPWELETLIEKDIATEGLKRLDWIKRMDENLQPDPGSAFGRVASLETSCYMRNQLLRDSDWAGMVHSLEIRLPYVDLELLKQVSPIFKFRSNGFKGKQWLAESPESPLPQQVRERKKTGFNIPVHEWLEKDDKLDAWRRIPSLSRTGCHWSRRWAYTVSELSGFGSKD